jgi:type II secretory pathway predicted ATPase ExeA
MTMADEYLKRLTERENEKRDLMRSIEKCLLCGNSDQERLLLKAVLFLLEESR